MVKPTKLPFTLNDVSSFKSAFHAIENEMKKRLEHATNGKEEARKAKQKAAAMRTQSFD